MGHTLKDDIVQLVRKARTPVNKEWVYDKVGGKTKYAYAMLREAANEGKLIQINGQYTTPERIKGSAELSSPLRQEMGILVAAYLRRPTNEGQVETIRKHLDVERAAEGYILFSIYHDLPLPEPTMEEVTVTDEMTSRFRNWLKLP